MADNNKGILLESGTNELEVLVFTLGKTRCGVNVAKVREVIGDVELTKVPKTHPAVVGVANLRGRVIPIVDLALYFRPGAPSDRAKRNFIVTEFNDMLMGFVVDEVEQIFRLSWTAVEPLPLQQQGESSAVTSVCHIDENLVLMIDFEKIALDIQGVSISAADVGSGSGVDRAAQRLLLAEDSPTMRSFIAQTLSKAGFANVTVCGDGQEAWEELQRNLGDPSAPPYAGVISDIEMPRMDGLHLCKRLREQAEFKETPIVIFSSLVSDDNLKKMSAVGADATLTKPQLVKLVEIIDSLISKRQAAATV